MLPANTYKAFLEAWERAFKLIPASTEDKSSTGEDHDFYIAILKLGMMANKLHNKAKKAEARKLKERKSALSPKHK